MEVIDLIKFFFVGIEPLLMLIALACIYRVGATARAILYMCLIMLGKEFVDIIFQQGFSDIYYSFGKIGKMNMAALWHLFYTLSEGAFVGVAYILLTTHRVQIKNYIRVLVITAAVRAYLHVAQGIEVVFFTTRHIEPVYKYGVPFLDYIMIAALFVGAYQSYQKRLVFGERIAWTS